MFDLIPSTGLSITEANATCDLYAMRDRAAKAKAEGNAIPADTAVIVLAHVLWDNGARMDYRTAEAAAKGIVVAWADVLA